MNRISKLLSFSILLMVVLFNCNEKKTETVEPVAPKKYVTALDKSIERGALVYQDFCINCHMANGEGAKGVFPPLANSDYLKNNQLESVRGIKYGQSGEIVVNGITYNSVMAAQGLEDDEVADVMNYINNAWGNNYGEELTEAEVAKITK